MSSKVFENFAETEGNTDFALQNTGQNLPSVSIPKTEVSPHFALQNTGQNLPSVSFSEIEGTEGSIDHGLDSPTLPHDTAENPPTARAELLEYSARAGTEGTEGSEGSGAAATEQPSPSVPAPVERFSALSELVGLEQIPSGDEANEQAEANFQAAVSKTSKAQKRRENSKSRNFMITQYVNHPVTDAVLLTQERLAKGLASSSTLEDYAVIIHDKDCVNEEDLKEHTNKNLGDPKPIHIHLIVKYFEAVEIKYVSGWFGISSQYIRVPKEDNAVSGQRGRGAGDRVFNIWLEYLTHEHPNQSHKFQYDRSEVLANFNVDARLSEFQTKRGRSNSSSKVRERRDEAFDKAYRGVRLSELRKDYPDVWIHHHQRLKGLRGDYLNNAPMPSKRTAQYFSGSGGVGKDFLIDLFATSLYPEIEDPNDIYFRVGNEGVEFQGYDGQPVLIFEDWRSGTFIKRFGREMTFNILNDRPRRQKQNVKFGDTNLIHEHVLISGPDDYRTFLEGLSGGYTDRRTQMEFKAENPQQAYRRFPMVYEITETQIMGYYNLGLWTGNRQFLKNYESFFRVPNNLFRLSAVLDALSTDEEKREVGSHFMGQSFSEMISRSSDFLEIEPSSSVERAIEEINNFDFEIEDVEEITVEVVEESSPNESEKINNPWKNIELNNR